MTHAPVVALSSASSRVDAHGNTRCILLPAAMFASLSSSSRFGRFARIAPRAHNACSRDTLILLHRLSFHRLCRFGTPCSLCAYATPERSDVCGLALPALFAADAAASFATRCLLPRRLALRRLAHSLYAHRAWRVASAATSSCGHRRLNSSVRQCLSVLR